MDSTRSEGRPASGVPDRVAARACRVDAVPVRTVVDLFERPRLGWADADGTTVAGGTAAVITASGADRFEAVSRRAQAVFGKLDAPDPLPDGARPRFYGGFAFTDDHGASGFDSDAVRLWRGFPATKFVLPAVQASITGDGAWLTTAATGPDAGARAAARLDQWQGRLETLPTFARSSPPGVRSREYDPPRPTWRRQVAAAIDRIREGQLRKVVLAQSLSIELGKPVAVADVLARLGDIYPSCYRFLFEPATGGSFFGATPEQLVTVRGTAVETEALAGSIGRQGVRQLANVQHLRTPIRATLPHEEHVLSLVEALHPTPAVGGLPPERALETIRETEAFERGWYAAPVGWFDADGNGTFAVAIRSAVTRGTQARLFAGAGIVRDSDPDVEWDELQLKYRPVLDELQ
ncbi:isochorismate synthase [Halobacteriales archaeon QH_2_66_30]|nr:MAG: isochorismate synthase [Halobacteriales archaeon QH_2_66_30]